MTMQLVPLGTAPSNRGLVEAFPCAEVKGDVYTIDLRKTHRGDMGSVLISLSNELTVGPSSSQRMCKIDLSHNGTNNILDLCYFLEHPQKSRILNVTDLDLSGNGLGAESAERLAKTLQRTSQKVKAIDLSGCSIARVSQEWSAFFGTQSKESKCAVKLESFRMNENLLNSVSDYCLLRSVGSSLHLRHLELSGCLLDCGAMEAFCSGIQSAAGKSMLTTLVLSQNRIRSNGLRIIAAMVVDPGLKYFDHKHLRDEVTHFRPITSEKFAQSFERGAARSALPCLRTIDLSGNLVAHPPDGTDAYDPRGLLALAEAVRMQPLSDLSLDDNDLARACPAFFPYKDRCANKEVRFTAGADHGGVTEIAEAIRFVPAAIFSKFTLAKNEFSPKAAASLHRASGSRVTM